MPGARHMGRYRQQRGEVFVYYMFYNAVVFQVFCLIEGRDPGADGSIQLTGKGRISIVRMDRPR